MLNHRVLKIGIQINKLSAPAGKKKQLKLALVNNCFKIYTRKPKRSAFLHFHFFEHFPGFKN